MLRSNDDRPTDGTLFGVVALSVNAKYTFVLLITAVIYPLKHLNVD